MGKIDLTIANLKSAGVYTVEFDNSQRVTVDTNALRLLVGFNPKGVFNRPVFLESDGDREEVFGSIDTKLEKKGCYFNRFAQTLLTSTPIFALNLLKVDDSQNGPDQVNFASMSLDAATPNPFISGTGKTYGEPEYNIGYIIDLYGDKVEQDAVVPYVGKTPYASLFDRSRFWEYSDTNLTATAANKLETGDVTTFEHTNFLNFANVGTEEMSLLVFKPENLQGYDITAKEWYGGEENIPYGWIRPSDYISDYFVQVIAIKGNWTNYPVLSTDTQWSSYFDANGIIKDRITSFTGAEGITLLGSWIGCIIPDFVDKQGNNQALIHKVNQNTETTGLLMAFNDDAAQALSFDYNGIDNEDGNDGQGCWFFDYDADRQADSAKGESTTDRFLIDMVGHNFMNGFVTDLTQAVTLNNEGFPVLEISIGKNPAKNFYYINTSNISNELAQESLATSEERAISTLHVVSGDSSLYYYGTYGSFDDGNQLLTIAQVTQGVTNDAVRYSEIQTDEEGNFSMAGKDYNVRMNAGSPQFSIRQSEQDEIKHGIVFMSYNYIADSVDEITNSVPAVYFNNTQLATNQDEEEVTANYYFTGPTIKSDTMNMFAILSSDKSLADSISVGDFVQNLSFGNPAEGNTSASTHLIPGLTRISRKIFVSVDAMNQFTYGGETCVFGGDRNTELITDPATGAKGFYLFTALESVLIDELTHEITRQLPISDDIISHSLRFIPMKGLKISNRHRPGYDENGNIDMEAGVAKIYSMLEDEGINRGLCNPDMIDYRYIIDSMGFGLDTEMGGKKYLSALAKRRGKTTAILNMPSMKQFATSVNPYFCDTYQTGSYVKPSFNTKYIPEGGNAELYASRLFSLPSEDNGSKYAAAFWPWLIYSVNGKRISVPPAADVANVFIRKFQGGDPYMICANMNGILSNPYLIDVEYKADNTDRDYLEPFGVDTIISRNGQIMIYGNQTCYQRVKSDFNKLHVRENLNTLEIESEAILHRYAFQYNNATTRASIVTALTPIFQTMQDSGALDSYGIVCDESNNTPEIIEQDVLVVDSGVRMGHGAEKILHCVTVNRLSGETSRTETTA